MSICMAVSTLPFIPLDINHISEQEPAGFIGMIDIITYHITINGKLYEKYKIYHKY